MKHDKNEDGCLRDAGKCLENQLSVKLPGLKTTLG